MLVNHGEARSLDLVMPPRAHAGSCPSRWSGRHADPVAGGPLHTTDRVGPGIENRARSSSTTWWQAATIADGDRLWPDLPRVALPCLSFVWEVVTSSAWRAADGGPGLIATDRDELSDWPYAALGLPTPLVELLHALRGRRPAAEALRLLDDRLADSVSAELTFAEWFSRWDAGPWPVVVDRIALGSAGLGPKSQCVPTSVKSSPRNVVMATLKQYGLTLVPFSDVFVITTEAELPRLESRDRWGERFAEALVWGSDRTDRFQTVARWRGEHSPRLVVGERGRGRRSDQAAARMVGLEVRGAELARRRRVCLFDRYAGRVSSRDGSSPARVSWRGCGVGRWLGRWRFVVLASVMAVCLLGGWLLPLAIRER